MHGRTNQEEAMLVRNLSKGNLLAFNSLYKNYSGRLYRFAYGYLKSDEEAEDLVQEVFTIIWEKRACLRDELCFKSFLFTIAFNILKKNFRSRTTMSEYLKSRAIPELDMQTSQNVDYNSLHQLIATLVAHLPMRRRKIFIMSRFNNLSIKEIARDLNISHKTVENQLTDALKYIRANLKRERNL